MTALQVWEEFFTEQENVNIVQLEDKSFWFQFSHLCKMLDYKNPTVALQTHCEDYEIKKMDIGQHEEVNFVSESGFYSLVLGSKKPKAKQFKKWICTEVLPKLRASGGYIMPTATSEQLGVLIKEANQKLMSKYRMRSVKFKPDKDGTVKMTVFRNGGKEYETYISDKSKPSLVNPQILICGHYDDDVDCCNIDIDSPMKEAYVRWRQYDDVYDRRWKRDELEDWVRVNFPVAA